MQLLSKLGFFFSLLVLFFLHFSFHFKGIYASHLTQVVHELHSIWLGKEHRVFCSVVFVFLCSLLLFWSSNKANYKRGKKKKKEVGLVEREPLKPFLLQQGTKECTKGMARPQQKEKRKPT